MIIGSSAVTLLAFAFLLSAEFKSKPNFYLISGVASIVSGIFIDHLTHRYFDQVLENYILQ